jgi:hypothetical protein
LYASSFIAQDDSKFDNTFYAEVFNFDIDEKYLEEMISLIHKKE